MVGLYFLVAPTEDTQLKTRSVTGSVRGRGAAQCVGGMTDVLPNTPPGFQLVFCFFDPDTRDTSECDLESSEELVEKICCSHG